MNKKILIIGAGPAGLSLAIKLKKSNIDCILLEKRKFPRNKTCGGLLTKKTVRLIENLVDEKIPENIIYEKTNKYEILNNNEKVISIDLDNDFYLCDRNSLDYWLVNEYKKIGGNLIENSDVNYIDNSHVKCRNGKSYNFDILVGADGVNSIIRKKYFNGKMNMAFGIETLIPNENNINKISLDLGLLEDGYLWCFPYGNKINVGFAESYNKNDKKEYKNILENYISKKYNYNKDLKIRGAFLPYGINNIKLNCKYNNVFLIGDAKGLTNPLTGEGIYYAIFSGINLAKIITEYNNIKLINKLYNKMIDGIINEIKKDYIIKKGFYMFKKTLLKKISKHSRLIKFYSDYEVQNGYYKGNIFKLIKEYNRKK